MATVKLTVAGGGVPGLAIGILGMMVFGAMGKTPLNGISVTPSG